MKTIKHVAPFRVLSSSMKTVKFYTLGCKVNQYDTQALRERFLARGFRELENGDPADTYIINTCTVTHKADAGSLGLIRRARRENPRARIIVTGCLAELDEARIKAADKKSRILKNRDKPGGISGFKGHTRAFLKIQDGCNNFCSYCRVPFARGRPRSKLLKDIIQEAEGLAKNGFKEIVLTGVCLGAYGRDLKPKVDLVKVASGLEKVKGLSRIRISSIEPLDISDELIKKIAGSAKLCRHLHIPLQSGDDTILKRMNRGYTAAGYLALIKKIKKAVPDIAITTDVLVGFPGESADNFQHTVDLIKEINPLKAHIFPYSPREATAAFGLGNRASAVTVKKRVLFLKDVTSSCALNYKKQFLGRDMDVLIESVSETNPRLWQGYTDNYIRVCLESGLNLKNKIIAVSLTKRKLG